MAGSDPVTAIFNALAEGLHLSQPIVNRALAEKYDKGHQERMLEWQGIIALPDDPNRANRIADYIMRILTEDGFIAGDFSGSEISIPIQTLSALLSAASDGIRQRGILSAIQLTPKT